MILETIHKYKRTLAGGLIISAVALVMTGFGLDSLRSGLQPEEVAISVDKTQISFSEFYQKRRETEDRMRQMFGAQYERAMAAFGSRLGGQVKEQLIDEALVKQESSQLGLETGDRQIQEMLHTYFQSAETYRNYLSNKGISATVFQNELRDSLTHEAFAELQKAAVVPARAEIEAVAMREETKYSGTVANIKTDDFIAKTAEPTDAELESYYTDHASDYEQPARASYKYAIISAAQVESLIEITPDMTAIYYSDHQSEFAIAPGVKAKQILIEVPTTAKPEERAKIKGRADALRAKITAPSLFESLVAKNSDDTATKNKSGELGWLAKGQLEAAIDSAIFALKPGEVTGVIEGKRGFYILKLDEKREAGIKPLESVQDEIRKKIIAEEAPAYIASKGEELLANWKGANSELEAVVDTITTVQKIDSLFTANQDPAGLKGLTARVLQTPNETRQLHDLQNGSVLVQVVDYKEPEVPGLKLVRDQVVAAFKKEAAFKLAEAAAKELVTAGTQPERKSLKELALAKAIKTEEFSNASRTGAVPPQLQQTPELSSALFAVNSPNTMLSKSFPTAGGFVVAEVTTITRPTAEELKNNLKRYEANATERLSGVLSQSYLKRLRANATIKVNARVEAE